MLAQAQQAEVEGDLPQAVRHLRTAAAWYQARDLVPRAEQMLRHAARIEAATPSLGSPEDDFGFGDGFAGELKPAAAGATVLEVAPRGPRLDSSATAWCSFCCRPTGEVGPVAAGPAGAFICAACVRASVALLPSELTDRSSPAPGPGSLLPSQRRAVERLAQRPRCALLLGPSRSGLSTVLRQLTDPSVLTLDLAQLPSDEEVRRVLAWLDARPTNRVVIAAHGQAPTPALVLRGEGEQPETRVYDSVALAAFVGALGVVVDAVVELETPDVAALRVLAHSLLDAKQAVLGDAALTQLVEVAWRTGGVGELAALVARIPAGRYR
jgi:hypothetical protein